MNAADRYRIAINIVAKMGLDHPQFINEYSKAVSFTQGMDSFSAMQAQQPVIPPSNAVGSPLAQNEPTTEPLGGGDMPSTPQGGIMP
jgi:hypothetical protein